MAFAFAYRLIGSHFAANSAAETTLMPGMANQANVRSVRARSLASCCSKAEIFR